EPAGRAAMALLPPGLSGSGVAGRRNEEISELIEFFSKYQYRAKEKSGTAVSNVELVEKRCLDLFGRDYKFSVIQNPNGELCGHYPQHIVFLEYECTEQDKDGYESTIQVSKLQELVNRSKMARCRGRFVCPVILYNGKNICRSATLAGWGELYGRTGYNYIFSALLGGSDDAWADSDEVPDEDCVVRNMKLHMDLLRNFTDIWNKRQKNCVYICSLSTDNEMLRKGKQSVTSSEKVDKAQRYADFTLLSIPYPGCEFFKDYKDRDYSAEGLVFNWNQTHFLLPLVVVSFLFLFLFPKSQSWDLVHQTQNYLKLLIHIINSDDESGLLVHCISGWDRTPLFISLLRLSLWADGLIHAALEPAEILYLTIAYDWFLFGHMLPDRLSKGEEIFFFCFNFLKHITSDGFSAVNKPRSRKENPKREVGYPLKLHCSLGEGKDRGSTTSLSSDFSLITEDSPATVSSGNCEGVDLISSGMQYQAAWRRVRTSSPQTCVWSKTYLPDERVLYPTLVEARSSSSSSSNQSECGYLREGSSPLAVPERRSAEYSRPGSSVSMECGSWQIVSGCGSVHDQRSITESPLPFSFQDE
uniref:Myotubularin related protein 14 n=1 Tax=Latimeria chalumnae TaxID=7897 RepID=H3AX60_LATCH